MMGVIMESFKVDGKVPLDRDTLTIFVIRGTRVSRFFFRSQDGIGSSGQDLLGNFLIIASTSSVSRS